MFKQATLGLSLTAAALAASSCSSGSGGGSTAVSGLSAPDQLEIVQAVEGTSSTGSVGPAATDPGFEPTASYYTDPQNVYVYDPAVEPLQLVNRILCFMGQTGADTIVNEDPYIAQVDVAACEDGGNQSSAGSSSGQSSTGGGEEIQLWTVSSQRASNSAPHDVHIWVPDEEGGPERIFVDLEITESPSTENPFGQFTMNYARSDTFANIATPEMIGSLRSVETPIIGDVGFTFFEGDAEATALRIDLHGQVVLPGGIGGYLTLPLVFATIAARMDLSSVTPSLSAPAAIASTRSAASVHDISQNRPF